MNDPLRPHSHDNNVILPEPYAHNPHIILAHNGTERTLTLSDLNSLPQTTISYTYTTDHGRHGPYQLSGVPLTDLFDPDAFTEIEVISADGFGNRINAAELEVSKAMNQPILLCTMSDNRPLTPQNGLIRLVVPTETDNALRQIKWVHHIRIR